MLHKMFGHPIEQINIMRSRLERLLTTKQEEINREIISKTIDISLIYMHLGQYSEALAHIKEAICTLEKTAPGNKNTIRMATYLEYLSIIQGKLEMFPEALDSVKKSLTILSNIFGDDCNRLEIATAYNAASIAYRNLGNSTLALCYADNSLIIIKSIYKPSDDYHLKIANCYDNIGLAYQDLGNYREAKLNLEKSLHVRKTIYEYPEANEDIAQSLYNLGALYLKTKNYSLAIKCLEKSLKTRKKPDEIALTSSALGLACIMLDLHNSAVLYIENSLKIRHLLPKGLSNSYNIVVDLDNIASVYTKLGRIEDAFIKYKEAFTIITTTPCFPAPLAKFTTCNFTCFLKTHLDLSFDQYPDSEIIHYELNDALSPSLANKLRLAFLYEVKSREEATNILYINKAAQLYKTIFESNTDYLLKTNYALKNAMLLLNNNVTYDERFKQAIADCLANVMRSEQNKLYLFIDQLEKKHLGNLLGELIDNSAPIKIDLCILATYLFIRLLAIHQLPGWHEKIPDAFKELKKMLEAAMDGNDFVNNALYKHAWQELETIAVKAPLVVSSRPWTSRITAEEGQISSSSACLSK